MSKGLFQVKIRGCSRKNFHPMFTISSLFSLNLVYFSASQMQILWQFSAIHCSSSCLYVASSGGCLAEGPSLPYHLFNIKSLICTVCPYRMPAFVVYSVRFQICICMLSLRVPLMLGSWSSECIKIIPH